MTATATPSPEARTAADADRARSGSRQLVAWLGSAALPLTLLPVVPLPLCAAMVLALLVAAARVARTPLGAPGAVLGAAAVGALVQRATGSSWQVLPAAVLVLGAVLALRDTTPGELRVRLASDWRRSSSSAVVGGGAVVAVVAALVMHSYLARNGSITFLTLAPPALVAVAVLNALFEEFLWRGAVWRAVSGASGSATLALVVQSASFGLAHWSSGYPSGPWGSGLAALVGLAVGMLRRASGSLLLPVAVHAVVDLTIFAQLYG
jgi:membrane protease YdiL (CAAX protease family)